MNSTGMMFNARMVDLKITLAPKCKPGLSGKMPSIIQRLNVFLLPFVLPSFQINMLIQHMTKLR
jgi:hypothetical protein